MISVRNHRPLLNGNNLVVFLLAIALFSCGALRQKNSAEAIKPKQDKVKSEDKGVTFPGSVSADDKLKQEKEQKAKKGRKDEPDAPIIYKIALVLPFSPNEINNTASTNWDYISHVADYYNGLKLALDSLKKTGFSATLSVYYNERDSAKTVALLNSKNFDSLDLIIGPFDKASFTAVSNFSYNKKIPLVSPFNTFELKKFVSYVFFCNPNLQSYAHKMVNHIQKQKTVDQINVVYVSDGKSVDKSFGLSFTDSMNKSQLKFKNIKKANLSTLQDLLLLDPKVRNIVVVPSDDEGTANALFTALRSYDKGNVEVYGLETWQQFKAQDYKRWENFKVHLLTNNVNLVDNVVGENYLSFYYNYREKYSIPPGDFALKGFDHMLFFGNALHSLGKEFYNAVSNSRFDGMHNNMHWLNNNSGKINASVRLLRFSEYRLVLID